MYDFNQHGLQIRASEFRKQMFCLNLSSTDPFFNLAVDEYLLKNSREEFLILGINERSVIIGKHQCTHRETDTKFITLNSIPVIRRITGGGTVFHDTGNLNFSFILNSRDGRQIDFRKYTLPVIGFLSSLGIEAEFGGKNDLLAGGLKISGNAEHVYRDRVLHHGTLLFNASLEMLRGSLRKDTSGYKTRAVRSNPSPVINLAGMLRGVDTIKDFRSLMLNWFLENNPGSVTVELTSEENERIRLLADTKYQTWEWNYAYGPEYQFSNRFEYKGKDTMCDLSVKDGIVWESDIKGSMELEKVCKNLIGCRHMMEDLQQVLKKENIFTTELDIYNFF